MAIRYSGDLEVRVQLRKDRYYAGTIRGPHLREPFGFPSGYVKHPPGSPEAYDVVAHAALDACAAFHRSPLPLERDKRGNIVVRRVFQSACPE